jgi:hypothetical protein
MDVHVSDGLAGGRPIVDADVEGVRGELRVENPLLFSDDLEQRGLLLERQFEKRPHVSMRYRERVTRRDRIAVAYGKRQGIRCDNPPSIHRTKRAIGRHAPFYPNMGRERGQYSRWLSFVEIDVHAVGNPGYRNFGDDAMTGPHPA